MLLKVFGRCHLDIGIDAADAVLGHVWMQTVG
jgi:hypothetical protein